MRRHRQWIGTALVALALCALTVVYRFNTLGGPLAGFDNDHFFQIVRAEAMLDGELSLRDYADAELRSIWPQLTYATSAVAMRTLGQSLRSEAILSVGMLALGTVALMWASAEVSQSILPAAIMTLLAVALNPTLYNYPKIVPYAFAVIAFLAYARHPSTARLILLVVIEVVATLYRHDHGVYIGLATGVLLLLVHGPAAPRPLLRYGVFVLVGLTPGLLFVQVHGGIVKYLRECLATSRREVGRTAAPGPRFTIDWSQPLLVRVPAPEAPLPRVAIRWASDTSPDDRAAAERELGLRDPAPRGDDRNWSYALNSGSAQQLALIVRDHRVADTDGIDRERFVLTSPPPPRPSRGVLMGWRVAPGLLTGSNAAPWLRLVAWTVIVASLACLLVPSLRQAVMQPETPPAAMAAITVMGALVCFVFLRNPGAFRLPDASVPIAVLGSWLLASIPRIARYRTTAVRIAVSLVMATVVVLSVLSVAVTGSVREQVLTAGVYDGASGVSTRWRDLWSTLGALPASLGGIDEKLAAASSYLRRCTRPADRLIVADALPEVYYFAQRRVAAGQMVFFGGFYTADDQQREAIARWQQQQVPIVLVQSGEHFTNEFASDYPLLASYLQSRYRRAGSLEVERGHALDVWADNGRAFSVDRETSLPCEAVSR